MTIYDVAMPRTKPLKRDAVYWWTAKIAELRASCSTHTHTIAQEKHARRGERRETRRELQGRESSEEGNQGRQSKFLEATGEYDRKRSPVYWWTAVSSGAGKDSATNSGGDEVSLDVLGGIMDALVEITYLRILSCIGSLLIYKFSNYSLTAFTLGRSLCIYYYLLTAFLCLYCRPTNTNSLHKQLAQTYNKWRHPSVSRQHTNAPYT